MKKNYVWDFLLPFYVAESEYRPIMNNINKSTDGHIYATDAHMVISVPIDKTSNDYETIEKYPNVEKIMSEALALPNSRIFPIVVNDLLQVLSKAKWHKATQTDKCPDCKGEGEVMCPACEYIHECEKCNGDGEVNKRIKEFSLLKTKETYAIEICHQRFNANHLHIIAMSAKVAGIEEIEYIAPEEAGKAAIFMIEDVTVLLMPSNCENANYILNVIID